MFVKFITGLSNAQKQSLITQAQVDLQDADWNDIPDLALLQSRILQQQVWVYPCGVPADKKKDKYFDSTKSIIGPKAMERCDPPCGGGGGDCNPYQVWQNYDNFYEALLFFLDNSNIRSASKAIITDIENPIAMCEDFFIKIKTGYAINDFSTLISYYGLTSSDVSADFGSGVYKISESRGGSRFCIERANIFFGTGMCDFSVPNFYEREISLTNDPLWSQQWSLLNTGQHNGTIGADIRVEPAWAITQGNNVKVAVIDNGVQLNHPDLQANLLSGFDAITGTVGGGQVGDDRHGTNCAGIIGAIANNNIGIAGIAPACNIIPVRSYSSKAAESTSANAARAINWAWQNGADVLSCSWKLKSESDLVDQAINNAVTLGRNGLGGVVVFAAGNDGYSRIKYPARNPEVIAVGAMSMCNTRVQKNTCVNENEVGSDYGIDLDIVAPGIRIATLDINSTTKNDFHNTSSACPHVAGVAALVLAVKPNLTLAEVKRILQYSCNKVGPYCYRWTQDHPNGGWNNEMGYGRINANNAVQLAMKATSFSNPVYNAVYQNSTQVSNSRFQLVVGTAACSSLSASVYSVHRHEITTSITFPSTPNPLIICNSNGWSAANPNDGKNFATSSNITNTSATLKTWVYEGYNLLGQFVGWFPASPENVRFNYVVIGSNGIIDYQSQRTSTLQAANSFSTSNIQFQFDDAFTITDKFVNNEEGSKNYIIYPNPSNDFVFIQSVNPSNREAILEIIVLNLLGQVVQDKIITSEDATGTKLDNSKIKPGIYVMQIITNKKIYNKKFIK